MWRLAYFGRQALRSLQASPVLQAVAISTIAVALMVLGAVGLVLTNLDELVDRWTRGADIVAFVTDEVSDQGLAVLGDRISQWDAVGAVRVRSRAAALAELARAFPEDRSLLDGVDVELLPAVLEVELVPAQRTPEGRAAVAGRLRGLPDLAAADAVDDGADLTARLERVRALTRAVGAVIGVLAMFAVVFIISNTVRLTLFARRDELEIMQLVGATDGFIRGPCYLEGAAQGMIGAALAALGVWVLSEAVPAAELLGGSLDGDPGLSGVIGGGELQFLPPSLVLIGVVGAGAVGVVASHLATNRFLLRREESPR